MENVIFLGIGVAIAYAGFHVLHSAKVKDFEEKMWQRVEAIYKQHFSDLKAEFKASWKNLEAAVESEVAEVKKKFKGSK